MNVPGIDRVLNGEFSLLGSRLRSLRLGLLTNDLALTSGHVPTREALVASGWRFEVFFGPEHGLSGRAREGEHVPDAVSDGVPVRSLYGDGVRPASHDLEGLDAVIVDLPDVGARFYTYVWTVSHMLEACADAGVAVIVLDRPNPLGADISRAEGPMLDEACQSLVGRWPMPIRHGLTIGELCRHWVRTRGITVDLDVVPALTTDASPSLVGGEWMPPSPNMPTPLTALLYPGTCLAEGVNLAEGRGTAVPFRVMAAPFLDGNRVAARIRDARIPGLSASTYGFAPLVRDHAGVDCDGIILHVTDPRTLRPVNAGVRVLSIIAEESDGLLTERESIAMPGESPASALEKLFGQRGAFDTITRGEWNDPASLAVPEWEEMTRPDLLYTRPLG